MTPALEKEGLVALESSRGVQRQAQRTSEKVERSQKQSSQGKMKSQLSQTLPTRVQDSQARAFSHGQCVQYGHKSYGVHRKRAVKDEKNLSTQIIDEITLNKSSIDLKLGKFDAKFNKLTSNIYDSNKNDRTCTEWNKVSNARLESISSRSLRH
ncbi:hypothetical protein O181_087186 [Austropuccinia psidii MF-1]|uniref:Uncharacterized protein n=1 Tax=Austropuccinia psidii MF-1 TaxID=1389203 RepID=A0A9Q3IP77_9BASI|nr:hypothetical protein [Austropuccinia psidii MF-1]